MLTIKKGEWNLSSNCNYASLTSYVNKLGHVRGDLSQLVLSLILLLRCLYFSILFTVPVADVNLVAGNGVLDEGKLMNLTCKTNHCNPRASINWYKGFQRITSGITNSYHNDSNSLEMTTSVLEYSGLANDNGLQVYCTANNFLNNTEVSSNITLDVKCKLNMLLVMLLR